MEKFVIGGGTPLFGDVFVSGSKNAALPLLFATVVTGGTSEIGNLPDISDIRVTLSILSAMGAKVSYLAKNRVRISTDTLTGTEPPHALTSKIRASTYLLGAMLARFGRARIGGYGGCDFSARPIDMHIAAARAFGAVSDGGTLVAAHLTGGEITFPTVSVGATVNALFLAAAATGESEIRNAAIEPHILALADFLRAAGAKIEFSGRTIRVTGAALHAVDAEVIPDMIEAGTYLLAAPITGGRIRVHGAPIRELSALTDALTHAGVEIKEKDGVLSAEGAPVRPIPIVTAPHPGFATDLQPPIAPLLAVGAGGSIREEVFCGRFGYLSELARFGLGFSVRGNTADIFPSHLHAAPAHATDLRGGAAAVLAALSARGKSEVLGAEKVLRGYEGFAGKLTALGAKIRLVT